MSSPLDSAKRIILKIGTSLVVRDGVAHAPWLARLAADVALWRRSGKAVVVVSSGAVALGRGVLGLSLPLRLEEKQAAAAAGQAKLMQAWESAFAPHGIPVAQALLTPDDTEQRRRWLNARATFEILLSHGAVPIVNENDTVATQELRYGDNDRLAARVAQLLGAEVLVLLSDVDGLYDRDPRSDPGARHIAQVSAISPQIEAMAGGPNARSGMGSGGMRTKLEAAKIAWQAGCATAITLGDADARPLTRLAQGTRATWVLPAAAPHSAYKAWLAGTLLPAGDLQVDAGAAAALRAGKSLLAAGVTAISPAFEKGDAVRVFDPAGLEIARGLVRYDAEEARLLIGRRSDEIEAALGYRASPVLIHADDLALLGRP